MEFPQCVYKDSDELGLSENAEYKIVNSLEELEALGPKWGKSQREELALEKKSEKSEKPKADAKSEVLGSSVGQSKSKNK